jgi:hypothetical protein
MKIVVVCGSRPIGSKLVSTLGEHQHQVVSISHNTTVKTLAFTGAGGLSVDAALSLPWDTTTEGEAALIGIGALNLAVLASRAPVARTLRPRHEQS